MTTTVEPAPRRAAGIQMHGQYAGSGYQQPRYLVVRLDGQAVHLTRMLYLVLQAIDGIRSPSDAAAEVSSDLDRELTAEGLMFLVENKLRPLGLIAAGAGTGEHVKPATADPVLRVRLHTTLITAGMVRVLGRLLAPLFWWPVITATTVLLIATDVRLLTNASLPAATESVISRPDQLLVLVALMTALSLFHELGHGAGCHRGGGRPGRIGVGLYLIFPAFYTDVTDAYRLSRRGRLRTDLGGIYFSGMAALAAGAGHLATGSAVLLLAAFLGQIGLVQQLLPVVRMDGYFILGDLTGVPDLFGRIKPMLLSMSPRRHGLHQDVADLRRSTRYVVIIWVVVVVPALTAGLVLFVLQIPTILTSTVAAWQQQWQLAVSAWVTGAYATVAIAALAAILGSLPIIGLGIFAVVLAMKAGRAITTRGRPLTAAKSATSTALADSRDQRQPSSDPATQPKDMGAAPAKVSPATCPLTATL